ncbi:hypothetical protein ACWGH9_19365, partial [Streptomyces chryseus]
MISTVVWGTGNVGRAAVRAVDAHPALRLSAVVVHDPAKAGRDAGELCGLGGGRGGGGAQRKKALDGPRPPPRGWRVGGRAVRVWG